jgi:hypothetical protein
MGVNQSCIRTVGHPQLERHSAVKKKNKIWYRISKGTNIGIVRQKEKEHTISKILADGDKANDQFKAKTSGKVATAKSITK